MKTHAITHTGEKKGACLLMFSAGRDSTIAAIRLSQNYSKVLLITVTSAHLVGIQNVRRRLEQLRPFMSADTECIRVAQPSFPSLDTMCDATCLPCQRAYVAIGAALARRFGVTDIALGYTKYQSAWPEQTPQAIDRLKAVLTPRGLRLVLPVYDLKARDHAEKELEGYGLTTNSLEQKCLKQKNNIEIPISILEKELDLWAQSLAQILDDGGDQPIAITANEKLKEVRADD